MYFPVRIYPCRLVSVPRVYGADAYLQDSRYADSPGMECWKLENALLNLYVGGQSTVT